MTKKIIRTMIVAVGATLIVTPAISAQAAEDQQSSSAVGALAIMGGSQKGTSTTLVRELAKVTEEPDGSGLRILPVVSKGAAQALLDVVQLAEIPVAVVQSDLIGHFAENGQPMIRDQVACLVAMQSEEMHIIANRSISAINDLEGKKVNLGPDSSGGYITSKRMFAELGIHVDATTFGHDEALEMLRDGSISAMTRVGGKPHKAIASVDGEALHLLPVSAEDVGAPYFESMFGSDDYPKLIAADSSPIETFAVSAAMVVQKDLSDAERANVDELVVRLPNAIEKLKSGEYHPKWQGISLAGTIDGCDSYQSFK